MLRTIATAWFALALAVLASPASTHAQSEPLELGVFIPGAAYDPTVVPAFEKKVGVPFASMTWYQDWSEDISQDAIRNTAAQGRVPVLIWQPEVLASTIPYSEVLGGSYDQYLARNEAVLTKLQYPVRIVLAPEVNASWSPWSLRKTGATPETYQAFFRYVVSRMSDAPITWVWAPSLHPSDDPYRYADLYPGDDVVDALGLSGFSTGDSFVATFLRDYQELQKVADMPIYLTEVGVSSTGSEKATWIRALFGARAQLRNLAGVTWYEMNDVRDWRIDVSEETTQAFTYAAKPLAAPLAAPTLLEVVSVDEVETAVVTEITETNSTGELGVTATVVGLLSSEKGHTGDLGNRQIRRAFMGTSDQLPMQPVHSAEAGQSLLLVALTILELGFGITFLASRGLLL